MSHVEMLVVALVLDALIGDPPWAWRRVPHPVVVMGRAIGWLDARLNRGTGLRTKGILLMGLLGTLAAALGAAIASLPDYGIAEAAVAAVLLAHRSLVDHVAAVRRALGQGIEAGRAAVARIVGRDTADLDESGVARAAIESGAENFSDGVVAPAFWFLLLGLPGLMLYKLVNTADSMIGHLDERYALFGWAAARSDDLMNWVPARIAGALIAVVALTQRAGDVMVENAGLHASPNAGWPEAAMAGALDVALGGPRLYEGELSQDPWLNPRARRVLTAADIRRCLVMLWRAWALLLGLVLLLEAAAWSVWTSV